MAFKALNDLPNVLSQTTSAATLPLCSLCSSHTDPSVLWHTSQAPPQDLCAWQCFRPGMQFFPQISMWLTFLPPSGHCSKSTFSQGHPGFLFLHRKHYHPIQCKFYTFNLFIVSPIPLPHWDESSIQAWPFVLFVSSRFPSA